MSRSISRYPGGIPKGVSLNYQFASASLAEFRLRGRNFQVGLVVTFWDYFTRSEVPSTLAAAGALYGSNSRVDGRVTLPRPGLYQVILQNPTVRKEAVALWIYSPKRPAKRKAAKKKRQP